MADKPETKETPLVAGTPEAEMAQLASQITGEADPTIIEGKDSVSPQDQPPPKGKDDKPEDKGDGTPASKGEDEPEVEGDGKPKDGEKKGGEEEDPLKDLAAKPDGVLKVLLEHPDIGPILNRWLDRASGAKVTTALEQQRPITEAETKQAEAERAEDTHFQGMTQEEISAEIAGDEKAATAYARYQQRKEASGTPNASAIAQASQIYSYAAEVSSVSSLLEESELTAEVKESLKPEHFTHLKAEGIAVWKKAVFQAILTHEATGIAEKLKEEAWEAYKEEHLPEIDGERPAIISGRREGPTPDLIKTDSGVLLEGALSGKKPKKGS
ncbi:hypothetical protein LCGC14_2124450 [marine sediment metagenome]|uniref:Uncharacterized protein n=1 Tax=marine sediment metagenome TaxID=412755 RepID=A0A0F9EQE9_9ZZZZ